MNTTPIGRMNRLSALDAPVVVAAIASSPREATMAASEKPITACEARERITGHARLSSPPKLSETCVSS